MQGLNAKFVLIFRNESNFYIDFITTFALNHNLKIKRYGNKN